MTTLYINGKFTAQAITGVQRVGHEMVLALDRRLAAGLPAPWSACVLVCPPGGRAMPLGHVQVRTAGPARRSLLWWEQAVLPWATRGGVLLNLSGSAPWASAERSVCMLHDAAVFDHPAAYTTAFRSWYRLLHRRLGRRALALLTVSAFARDRLVAALGVPPQRIGVIHNGADHLARVEPDLSVLAAYGLQPERFVLVVGTSKQTKNIESVLTAWRRMDGRAGRVLVWVGGVNARVYAELESGPVPAHDAADGIFRIGVISDERLKALYQHAAGLVLASHYEGFGLPAVEAMACGCPVAAASAASLPEVCGDAALLFDPHQVDAIGDVMKSLLQDAGLRAALRERGRARVAAMTWDAAAGTLVARLAEAERERGPAA